MFEIGPAEDRGPAESCAICWAGMALAQERNAVSKAEKLGFSTDP
jgi:hypothetical protein